MLSEVSADILDDDLQLAVRIRLAELCKTQLGDWAQVRDWYKKALALRSDDRKALVSLEALYEEMGDAPALLDVVRRRVEIAEGDQERRELLYRQAKLTRDVHDGREAISVYEAILDIGLDAPAIAALEELYASEGRHHDSVSLYERQIAEGAGDKADLHVKLAGVAEKSLSDVHRAFDELTAALAIEPSHGGAVASLERLLREATDSEHRARAGEMLEPVYLRRAEGKSVMATIEARLSASHEPGLASRAARSGWRSCTRSRARTTAAPRSRRPRKARSRVISDEARGPSASGSPRSRAPRRGSPRSSRPQLAGVTADEPHTAKLARRTGELYAAAGDVDRARVLPSGARVRAGVARPVRCRRRAARQGGAAGRARRGSPHGPGPPLRAAGPARDAARDRRAGGGAAQQDQAIETYRAALDVDEKDARSLDALTRLYRASQRYRDSACSTSAASTVRRTPRPPPRSGWPSPVCTRASCRT